MKFVENRFKPNEYGFYGVYGGAFIPEMLYPNVHELQESYLDIISDSSFVEEYENLLRDYVERPTPLFYSKNLSAYYNAHIYLKREDLNHTGSHKINNAIGQVLLAKKLGKKRVIAETGAGQHGVATATACTLLNMECTVFMGSKDMLRQAHNVERMRMLGTTVVPAISGSQTLKDATNDAIREWIQHPIDTHYCIGSVVGPHPYPDMVAYFQSVISQEIREQLQREVGTDFPHKVIACIGGGSNAMGAFYHFIGNNTTELIAVEAAGLGVDTDKTAAAIHLGKASVIHGSMTYLMQNTDGQIIEPHSISAGLDYPGIGPAHAFLHDQQLIHVVHSTDEEAVKAGLLFTKLDGIIPALESAHALAYLEKLDLQPEEIIVINL